MSKNSNHDDIKMPFKRVDRKGIYCCVCGCEETFYNMSVEKENRTEVFESRIYEEGQIDYLLYFCSPKCKENAPLRADERVPEDRKYIFADLREPEEVNCFF